MKRTTSQQRAVTTIKILDKEYPKARIALRYITPFQLLTAVILSAQCTDKKVNEVVTPIFKKYKTAKDFASITIPRLEKMIKQTGFYKSKARSISANAKTIVHDFNGKVPLTIEELLTLRGVARKTANVVLTELTGRSEGIAVDTHVRRLSNRLGISKQSDPVKIEQDLMKLIPKKDWPKVTHLLITHGRNVCIARKPKCGECVLNKMCPSAFKII